MKKAVDWVVKVAKNPALRPFEIWAIRAIVGFVAVKLGIDVKDLVSG